MSVTLVIVFLLKSVIKLFVYSILSYIIKDYTYEKAKLYSLVLKPSVKKGKKIDVYRFTERIASIGDIDYLDYPSYVILYGKKYAENRRRLYRIRHHKDNMEKYSPAWLSYHLLW